MTGAASNPMVMKRALWLLILLPGLCVFAFGDDRGTCEDSWHCVAPSSAFADTAPVVDNDGTATAATEEAAPAAAHRVASILLDVPGDK